MATGDTTHRGKTNRAGRTREIRKSITSFAVSSPASISGRFDARDAVFNPPAPWSVDALIEIVDDGTGTTSDACEDFQAFPAGRIALIDRGDLPRDLFGIGKPRVLQDGLEACAASPCASMRTRSRSSA